MQKRVVTLSTMNSGLGDTILWCCTSNRSPAAILSSVSLRIAKVTLMSRRTRKNKRTGSALLSTLAGRHHEPSRFRRLGIEVLEDRRVLDTAWLDPHGLFPGEQFPVGVSPVSVAVADLNGDGIPDLVTANHGNPDSPGSEGDVSVLLGRGDGTFDPQISIDVGSNPWSVAVGDLNGDGVSDLVTANYGSDTVSVLFGRGDGTFEPQTTFEVGSNPRSVAIADLNNDGIPDLITANSGSNTVSVLLGCGDGTFESQKTHLVGTSPYSVAVADLNRDGNPDLITVNGDSNDVSVLSGRGDGTFQAQETFPVGTAPRSVAVADFNRDGIPDLVTANYGSHNVSVLLGRADGGFETQKAFSAGSFLTAVVAADVNGDGNWEVLTTGSEVSVLSGAGDGTFDTRDRYAVGALPFGLAVADINGDGVSDLVTANRSGNNVSVLLGRGGGKFEGQTVVAAGACPKMAIAVADLNGNGILDVATSTRGGGNPAVAVLLGLGDGTFAAYSSYPVGADPQSLAVADVNRDGVPDLVTANTGAGTVSVLLGRGDGTFEPQATYAVGSMPRSVAVADVNRDGLLDLITANEDDDTVSVLLGYGDGTFQPHQTVDVGRNPASVAVADINGNGIPDLVTANSGSSDPQQTLSVLLGRGDGTFEPSPHAPSTVGITPRSVVVADINGDGVPDLVTANQSNSVSVLLGRGAGQFDPQMQFPVSGQPQSVVVADVNGDGVPDLVTVNHSRNNVSILLGRGDGTFHPHATYAAVSLAQAVAAGDLNGNGRMDLVTGGWFGPVSLLFRTSLTHSPAGVIHRSVQSVTVRFPSPMDTGSFSLSQDVTSFTGPNGPITPSGFTWLNDRTLRILFPLQARAGDYELVLGPAILDAMGNPMEQPYLASFHVIVAAWQNPVNRFDVDGDGYVTPLDALILINQINLHGSRTLPPRTADDLQVGYLDVNGDGRVTPEDVLDVINYINAQLQTRPTAEGENTTPTEQPDALAGWLTLETIVGLNAVRLRSPVHHERSMDIPVRRAANDGHECPSYAFGSVRKLVSEHLPLSSPDSHDTWLRPSRRPSSVYSRLPCELELPDGRSRLDSVPDHAADRDALFAVLGRT